MDWRNKSPVLTRLTAHLCVILLALFTIALSGLGLPTPRAAVGSPSDTNGGFSFQAASSPESMETPVPEIPPSADDSDAYTSGTIIRQPKSHTTIPDRVRGTVVAYVVQMGDTIYDIAARFGLSPSTIVWSNREAINDAPWLINPGLELFILPADGVYHTVRAGETVADIARTYGVESAILYNEWNDLEEGQTPREGQLLVVPGGEGEEIEWTPPPIYPMPGPAGLSYGMCSGATVSGPGANGYFVYPTGNPGVSGWYFHDPRNPTHIGIDYRCRTGDPLYAADNGVVTIAGWNGGYGIMVQVDHGNGFVTRYGHFSELAVGCGQPVYQSTLLGYCGNTGWSTGAHLHFEIRHQGVPQNPQAYLP